MQINQSKWLPVIKLVYSEQGRGGTILVQHPATSFELWWEFAGGNALVILEIPTENDWSQRTKLNLGERRDLLDQIGKQVLTDKVSGGGSFIVSDNVITFYANN